MRFRGISTENMIMRILGRFGDLIVVNFFTVILCVPIITAGASLTAGCTCLFKILGENAAQHSTLHIFFQAFKENFKQATQAWLIILIGLVLGGGDLLYAISPILTGGSMENLRIFYLVFGIVVLFVFIGMAIWAFPLIARYENKLGEQIKNSFFLAFGRLPRTAILMLMWVGPLVLCILMAMVMVIYAFLVVFIVVALELWATVRLEGKVFRLMSA